MSKKEPMLKKRKQDDTTRNEMDWKRNQVILSRVIYNMKQKGLTDKEVAGLLGTKVSNLNDIKKRYPAIDAAFIEGKAECVKGVIAQLFKTAMGGEEYKEVIEEDYFFKGKKVDKKIKKVKKVTQPNFKAMELILTNLDSDSWARAHLTNATERKDVSNGKPEADKINRLAGEILADDTVEIEAEFEVPAKTSHSACREQTDAADVSGDMPSETSGNLQDDVLDVSAED